MAKKKARTKKTSSKKGASQIAPAFEDSLSELRTIVSSLEQGNLTLSDSLEQYEQGVKSLKNCYRALDDVKRKISILVDLDEDGHLITRPFDDSASEFGAGGNAGESDDSGEDELDDDEYDEDNDDEEGEYDSDGDIDGSDRLF